MYRRIFALILPFLFIWIISFGRNPYLSLTIHADKPVYYAGDTIKVIYEWENIGTKDIRFVPLPRGYRDRFAWISVYSIDVKRRLKYTHKETTVIQEDKKDSDMEVAVSLRPGDKHWYVLEATVKKKSEANKSDAYYIDFTDSIILLPDVPAVYKLVAELEFPFGWYYKNGTRIFDRKLWMGRLASNEVFIKIAGESRNDAQGNA